MDPLNPGDSTILAFENDRADATARARRLLDVARAEAREGSLDRSWQACLDAARLARELADVELLAEAATTLADAAVGWATAASRQALCLEALGMLGSAREGEPPGRREWREVVQTHLEGLSTGWAERISPAHGSVDPVEAERRFLRIQTDYLHALGADGLPERLARGYEAVELGRASGDDHILAWGWHWRADSMQALGLRTEFNHAIGELFAVIERLRSPAWVWRREAILANIALLEDRLPDVPELAESARDAGQRAGAADAEMFDLILRSSMAQRTGTGLEEVEHDVRLLVAGAPLFAQGWRGEILLAMGRVDESTEILRTLMPHLEEIPRDVHEWRVGHAALCAMAVAARDRPAAERLYRLLAPFAHLHLTGPSTTPYGGPLALPLALASSFLGDPRTAERHAVDATARAEAMGAPWYAASARELVGRAGNALAPLSGRETEVARMVAQGLTNRDTADSLYLSERTVEQHVRSTLHQLGLSNRAGIAAWVTAKRT